jgi:hypothetical protein
MRETHRLHLRCKSAGSQPKKLASITKGDNTNTQERTGSHLSKRWFTGLRNTQKPSNRLMGRMPENKEFR